MPRTAQRKRSIKDPQFSTHFIPSFNDFMEFLQIPSGPIAIERILRQHNGINLGVSRSTLGKLNNEGVSSATWNKLVSAMAPLMKNVEVSIWVIREAVRFARIRSNYPSWLGLFKGYKAQCDCLDDWFCKVFIRFVEERAEHQKQAMVPIYRMRKHFQSRKTSESLMAYHKKEASLYRSHSLIPDSVIDSCLPILTSGRRLEELSHAEKEKAARYCIYQQWDFYLSALAYFEAVIHYIYFQSVEQNDLLPTPFEIISRKLASDEGGRLRNCFEALLDNWRSMSKSDGDKLSWVAFAAAIPTDPADSPSGETAADRRKSQMNKWRSGKDYPSDARLREFLNGHQWVDPDFIELMLFQARLAKGFDKLAAVAIEGIAQDDVSEPRARQILREIWGRYSDYYGHAIISPIFIEWTRLSEERAA